MTGDEPCTADCGCAGDMTVSKCNQEPWCPRCEEFVDEALAAEADLGSMEGDDK